MGSEGDDHTPAGYFDGFPDGLAVFVAVRDAVAGIGEAAVRVTKSQIAFRRRKGFAYVWRPSQRGPGSLVDRFATRSSIRTFQVRRAPATNVWMHHIELHEPAQIDDEVCGWLAEAYENAT